MRVTKSSRRSPLSRNRRLISQAGPDIILLVGLLVLAVGLGFAAHAFGWHRVLIEVGRALIQQPRATLVSWYRQNTVPTLNLDIPFVNYETLTQARDQALRLGAYVPDAQDCVAATVRYEGADVPVELQLLAGSAAAFQGDLWSLSIHAEDAPLLGRTEFNLIPSTRDVLTNWGYLETLRRSDVLAVEARIVRLSINGDDKGLYVLEEVPTPAMVAPDHLVVGFDATVYWSTVVHLGETVPDSGFQYADIMVLGAVEEQALIGNEARQRLYAVQSGQLAPAHAFDVASLARFMALTTLWQGTPTVDWRTVRWAYDPNSRRFTPIGRGYHPEPLRSLPEIFIDDPVIQIAYARALREYSQTLYLTELKTALAAALEDLRLRLGVDLGNASQVWSTLETHQRLMRAQLSPSQPVAAYFTEGEEGMWFGIANLQQLPVEIVGLNVGENVFVAGDPAWVVTEDRPWILQDEAGLTLRGLVGPVPHYVHLQVPFETLGGRDGGTVRATVRIAGLPSQEIDVAVVYDDLGLHFPHLEARP